MQGGKVLEQLGIGYQLVGAFVLSAFTWHYKTSTETPCPVLPVAKTFARTCRKITSRYPRIKKAMLIILFVSDGS